MRFVVKLFIVSTLIASGTVLIPAVLNYDLLGVLSVLMYIGGTILLFEDVSNSLVLALTSLVLIFLGGVLVLAELAKYTGVTGLLLTLAISTAIILVSKNVQT